MAAVALTSTEARLRDVVGTNALLAGRRLAADGVVDGVVVDARTHSVTGRVRVRDTREEHETTARLRVGSDGVLTALEGWCTCGRAVPCRHAVALLLHLDAAGAVPVGSAPGEAVPLPRPAALAVADDGPAPVATPAPWEGVLAGVISDPPAARRRGRSARPEAEALARPGAPPPVALQFDVAAVAPHGIGVRIVTPGRAGGWVRSGSSWAGLRYGDWYYRQVPPAHLQLLREMVSLPTTAPHGLHDKAIQLETVTSRRVWDLLLEAQEIGLPLVTSGRRPEPVRVHAGAVVARLDVRRDGDDLVVEPVLELADRRVPPGNIVIGEPPHGTAWSAAQGGGLDLARLAAPPHPLLSRFAEAGPLRLPAGDAARFLDGYYPQLAQHVEIVCRDGAVELPAAAPPALRLTVTGRGGHCLALDWAWVYTLGSIRRSEPLVLPADRAVRGRDAVAETGTLTAVTALLGEFSELTGIRAGEPHLLETALLDGVATARFMTRALPLLQNRPDVEVHLELTAQTPRYRESAEAPVIRFSGGDGRDEGSADGSARSFLEQDWFDLAVTVTVDGTTVPFEPLFVALAQGQPELVLDNGIFFRLDRPEFDQLAQLIAESRELLDAPPATVRLSRWHAAGWDDLSRLGEVDDWVRTWRDAVRALADTGTAQHEVPAGLRADLRPYQAEGFRWLATLHALRLGGVLADDMGLGKTVQALALMLHTREQGLDDRPFLVVAPTSVVANWAAEAARFAPDLVVRTVNGTGARRGHDVAAAVAGADLVVTSYTLFRLEFDEYRVLPWAALVLDEAQNVKNHQSTGYRCARDLPAGFKLAITGTPMENNLMELWSLLSITAPGLFARPDRFTEYYRHPIERQHDTERLGQLRRRITPLMLRRTKQEVARDLPDRQEQTVQLELHPRHRRAYATYLQRERQKVLGLLGDLDGNRFEIFRSLTLLRQASLDIALVDPSNEGIPSTKLDALLDTLEDVVSEGHRVLVFSQFTRFLGRARDRLDHAGIEHCYLDGTTRNRPRVIARFRNGEAPVFLISLKAGGAGLNLTEADYVILLDPWWNPATEAQAVDRAHRIGQTRKVMVYRFVAKDTIEEKVMALKERKAALTASVLSGADFASAVLTAEDIRGLLE